MQISSTAALWFLPFVVPICLWIIVSDLRTMRIPNRALVALMVVFAVIAPMVLPFADLPWRLVQLIVVLLIGFLLNATGHFGAGDAKFCAVAALFIAAGDGLFLFKLFVPILLGSYFAHRLVKNTRLRKLAPEWESWAHDKVYPMGIALGSTLVAYLALGVKLGV